MNEPAPTGLMDALWPVVSAALTPELVGAVAVTLAATHLVKVMAEHWAPQVTDTPAHWRAFCAATSVVIGTLAGIVTWALTAAGWFVVPIVALGSGPIWRLLQAFVPARVCSAFLTSTDRKHRRQHAR